MAGTRKRIVIGAGVAVLVLAALVVAMFAFGKPVAPQASPQAAMPSGVPAPKQGGAPEAGSDPLAVEIPGCVCHSDDPVVVEEHASYRMSQCFDCHSDGMPDMGQ